MTSGSRYWLLPVAPFLSGNCNAQKEISPACDPDLFTIHRSGPGTLSTMAWPLGGDWLDDEISALASADVRVLVSARP